MKTKKTVKVGDTIELVYTNDELAKLQPGDRGVVKEIEGEIGDRVIWIQWQKGQRLALLEEIDKFKVITL